jgi:hypothetical protein
MIQNRLSKRIGDMVQVGRHKHITNFLFLFLFSIAKIGEINSWMITTSATSQNWKESQSTRVAREAWSDLVTVVVK